MNVFSGPNKGPGFRAPIDPRGITLPETKSHLLECDAADLRSTGDDIATAGNDITSSWSGLTGCYSAPEDETLFAVLNPVATDGDDVDTALGSVATALETFAETAREIRTRLLILRGRAEAFNTSIQGDEDWDKGDIFGGTSDKVDELDELRSDIARAQEEFTAAEIECANAITALVPGGTHFKSADPDGSTTVGENEFVYGLTEIPADMATAWGPPAATDHHWWVDVSHAGWDWAAGGVVDLGGMTGTYHEGQWGVPIIAFGPMMPLVRSQGQANFQNYWGDTLTGVATLTGFYQGEGPERFTSDDSALNRDYAWDWDGWHIPESRHAWEDNVRSAAVEAAHGAVSWREWEQRPGYVLTQGTITGVTVAAGGFGLVKGGLGGLRALGRGDFDLNALTPDALRDLMAGGTLRSDGSTGGAPPPNTDGADGHRGPDPLGSARDALDELASHTHRTAEPTAPAPSPPLPPNRGDDDPTAPAPPERSEVAAPLPDGEGSDENAPGQGPTAEQLATQATLEDMLRGDPSLAETLPPDLLERLDTNGPDKPWVASPYPDADDDRVLAGVGGRGDDTLTESANSPAPTPDRPLDLTDIGDPRPDDRSPDLRDNTPTITNSTGDSGPLDGGPHDTHAQGAGSTVMDSSPTIASRDGGSEQGRIVGGRGGDHDDGPPSHEGSLLGSDHGSGPDGPLREQTLHRDSTDRRVRDLLPEDGQRFGDAVALEPNTQYSLVEADGRSTDYITDSDGSIVEIRAESRGWNTVHPEFLDPRPDMTYVVDQYTYRTDKLGRTVTAEGPLTHETNGRNESRQTAVGGSGRRYFQVLNEQIRNDFITTEGREPEPGEVPQYQDIQFDGGHLIGSQYYGIGDPLNMVPMRFDVNQNRTDTALADKDPRTLGGIKGAFYNVERAWRGILKHGSNWHMFGNPEFNDGSWNAALALNPDDPRIDVKVTNVYDPDMPMVEDPKTGKKIPAPPKQVVVHWSLNGVRMPRLRYSNFPPLQ